MNGESIETRQRGEWVDLNTFNHMLEARSTGHRNGKRGFDYKGLLAIRNSSHDEADTTGGGEFSLGTSERLYLGFGPLSLRGLPYELIEPFRKELDANGRKRVFSAKLDSGASAAAEPELFFSAESDRNQKERLRVGAYVSPTGMGSFMAGFESGETGVSEIRGECFFGGSTLPPETGEAWFSEEPPLPMREHRLWGGSVTGIAPRTSVFLCSAISRCETRGTGTYLETAVDVRSAPFRFLVAADGSTDRFVDAAGEETGERLRALGKIIRRFSTGNVFTTEYSLDFAGGTENDPRQHAEIGARFPRRAAESFLRLTEASGSFDLQPDSIEASRKLQFDAKIAGGRTRTTIRLFTAEAARPSTANAGLHVGIAVALEKVRLTGSAGIEAAENGERRWDFSTGSAIPVFGGIFRIELGTDAPTSWQTLSGGSESRSPLGPWSLGLSWSFQERF